MSAPAVELTGVSKSYGSVVALDDVSLRLDAGTVHCLAGENGAGKSTLINVLAGAVARDHGTYVVDGHRMPVDLDPAGARVAGIGVVHQELSLMPDLTVAENLFMGHLPRRRFGFVDRNRLRAEAADRLTGVGLDALDPDAIVAALPSATRQRVEIARALGDRPRVLVLDEPTTALSIEEADDLLAQVRAVRDAGVAVLYVSHRLEELFEVGDRITVLRDGAVTRSEPASGFTEDSLIAAMVGRDVDDLYPDPAPATGDDDAVRLRVRGLRPRRGQNTDLEVRAGEIVGVAGLLGAGRSELLRTIAGADRPEAGRVEVDGRPVRPGRPAAAVRAGIGLLGEDRREQGLLPDLSIRANVAVASLPALSRQGLLSDRHVAQRVDTVLDGLRLRAASYDDPVSSLSGGNQQKVLVARWLLADVRVLLCDEPTKGVDVGAKAELYVLLRDLAQRGLAIVVVSSYLPELIGLADRIVVLRDGRIVAETPSATATEEGLLAAASTEPQKSGPQGSGPQGSGPQGSGGSSDDDAA